MVVIELAVLDTYIASVLDNDCIWDLVIDCYSFCRVSGLSDTQFCSCFLCSYCSGRLDFFRIIAADCCCICCDYIHYLSSIDVCLSHFISVSEGCLFIWCECECLSGKICVIVHQLAFLDTHITLVLNNYGVCDRVSDCSIFCRIGSLGNAQFSFCILCRYFAGCNFVDFLSNRI